MRKMTGKICSLVNKIYGGAALLLLAILTGAMAVQVFTRYVLGASLSGTEELGRYCFIWMTMLGASACVSTDSHATVTILNDILKGKIKGGHKITVDILILACSALLFAQGIRMRTVLGTDSFPLLAIPLFTLGGYLMETGGLSKRLVGCIEKLLGGAPGSVGTVTIVCCTIFAALTGSGPATVAAIGAIMLPAMLRNGYNKSETGGILAAAGSLGPVIPPSICMIVYGSTMNVSIPDMFIAAIVPGLLLAASFVAVNLVMNRKKKAAVTVRYGRKEVAESFIQAVPVLLLPVIILGGIYTGIFTPTEAAVTCVIYSLILGAAYREMKLPNLVNAMKKTVVTSGMVMFIMAMSANFGWILSAAKIPATVANALAPYLGSRFVFTVLLLLLLFLAGCFMEVLALVVILAPILIPIGVQLGMDPLHLGVTFCIALVMGLITPPFGMNLFTAAAVCDTTFVEIVKGALPYICVALIMIVIFAFIPQITLFLPGLMAG